MYNFRTDMADERRDIYKKANKLDNIPGIETFENKISGKIKVNTVKITDEQGEQAIGKPVRNICYNRYKRLTVSNG